ncbi:MAG: HAD-IA family hydrolase [Planctomycetes bacterium]|nr:HAD-IA family hydrolase [Planctomycetota bacterium]
MSLRAVFFDAGWTLIHADPPVGEIYAREAARLGARVEPSRMEDALGKARRDYAARAAREGLPLQVSDAQDRQMWRLLTRAVHASLPEMRPVDAEAWFDRVHEPFTRAEGWRLYPDARRAIDLCRERGLAVGIVSNWSSHLLGICEGMGLAARVDFILASAVEGHAKPDGRIFERALRRARVSPAEALHVGDTYEEDVVGARGAGLRAVWVDRKGAPPRDGVPTVSSLDGLLPHMEGA